MKYEELIDQDKPDNIAATRNTDESKVKNESENTKSWKIKDVIETLGMQGVYYRYLPSHFIFCYPAGISISLALLDILPQHYKTAAGCIGNSIFSDKFLKFGVNDLCITELAESTELTGSTGPTKTAELTQPLTQSEKRKETLFNFLCRQLVDNPRLQYDANDRNDWNIWKGRRDYIIEFSIVLAKCIKAGCWIPDTMGVYPIEHIMRSKSFKGGIKHDIFRIYDLLIEFLLDKQYKEAVRQEWRPYFDKLWNCNEGAYFTNESNPNDPRLASPHLRVATALERNINSYTAKFLFQSLFVIGIKTYRPGEVWSILWEDLDIPNVEAATNIAKWATIEGLECVLSATYRQNRRTAGQTFHINLLEPVRLYAQKLYNLIHDHDFVVTSVYSDSLGSPITYQTRPNLIQTEQPSQLSTPNLVATANINTKKSDIEISTTATITTTTSVPAAKSIKLREALTDYLPDNEKETQAAVLLSVLPEQYKTEIGGCCNKDNKDDKDKKVTFDGSFLEHDLNDCFITEGSPTYHKPSIGLDIKSPADIPSLSLSVFSTTKMETLLGFICRKIKEKNDVLLTLIYVTTETNVTEDALNKVEQEINTLNKIAGHLLRRKASPTIPDGNEIYPFQHLIDSQYMSEGIGPDQKIVDMVKRMMDQLARSSLLSTRFSQEGYTLLDLIWKTKPSSVKGTKKMAKREGYPARSLFLLHLAAVFERWNINITNEMFKYTSSTDKDEIYRMWATMIAIQDIYCSENRSINLKLIGEKCAQRLKRILLEQSGALIKLRTETGNKAVSGLAASPTIATTAVRTATANDTRVLAFSPHHPSSTAAAENLVVSIGISKELDKTSVAARSGVVKI